ncbi:MAG: metalloregulator ArsR/SmtB family transcription factor [Faecalimonas sp.]|nr:metalloregulator ArsR/SmtB family transcription factor [Faecalimonas sp.]
MIYYSTLQAAADTFSALASPARLEIMQLLARNEEMNVNALAENLDLTAATISVHIKKLADCGLLQIRTIPGKHGVQKLCSLKEDKMLVELNDFFTAENHHMKEISIGIGHYSAYDIKPTCLLATKDGVIGELDDIRYFSFPQRYEAGFLCYGHGFLEYSLPNLLDEDDQLIELQVSFELASEAPGHNDNYPSDVYFQMNGVDLGFWTSPGDYGEKRGYLNPSWYPDAFNQYGLLKILIINRTGTYIDGNTKISDVTIDQLGIHYQSKIDFRITSPENTQHPGGVSLFGAGFGNYDQDIVFKMFVR